MASTASPPRRPPHPAFAFVGTFHLWMAAGIALLAILTLVGCLFTGIQIAGFTSYCVASLVVAAMLSPLPAYWYEKRRRDLADSALIILWAFLEAIIVPTTVRVAARLRMPLRDEFFGKADRLFRVDVSALVTWAGHHWLGSVINESYEWVLVLMPLAVLLPVLAGKRVYARRFVLANLLSFAIGLPLFALLPAIGPWRYYHFQPAPLQLSDCEAALLALRLPGPYILQSQSAGVVCFPSFHVVWAVLAAYALWDFRLLRIPMFVVSSMIVLSTMTTGWHYFTDVAGGLVLAGASLLAARSLAQITDISSE